ncbi:MULTISPECIES: four helix bundle protein [unclassified Lacinutrix]
MRNYKNLKIWEQGIELVKQIYVLTAQLPATEKFGLKSQITRAAISIPSNIAEGCSRNSELEFKRFLEIAMGSLFEVDTQLIIIKELKFIKPEDLKSIFELIETEGKMINGLINTIKNS